MYAFSDFLETSLKNLPILTQLALLAAFPIFTKAMPASAQAQFKSQPQPQPQSQSQSIELAGPSSFPADSTAFEASSSALVSSPDSPASDREPPADAALPTAPEPAMLAAGGDHYEVKPSATWHQIPFSRMSVGANVNPMGIGINSTIVLNHYFDGRVIGNFFGYNGHFDIEGYSVNADFHFASMGGAVDFYPFGSVFRVSPGVLFYNGNQLSGSVIVAPGNSFSLEGQNYYSAYPITAPGATPVSATGTLGLHKNVPAFTVTGGFGKYIPRSDRHWSFPSEFGVAFTGAPTINVKVAGWACLDEAQTECSDVGSTTNPVGIEFNNDLQTRLTKVRQQLDKVNIYPLFSYSVVYSFNIR